MLPIKVALDWYSLQLELLLALRTHLSLILCRDLSAGQTVQVCVTEIQTFNPHDKVQSNLHTSMDSYAAVIAAGPQEPQCWVVCINFVRSAITHIKSHWSAVMLAKIRVVLGISRLSHGISVVRTFLWARRNNSGNRRSHVLNSVRFPWLCHWVKHSTAVRPTCVSLARIDSKYIGEEKDADSVTRTFACATSPKLSLCWL
jgi:hypothetical protein